MSIEDRLREVLAHDVLGMTMKMVNNCYLNMEDDEFQDFLSNYDKQKHKYESQDSRCDGCNGVEMATYEIIQAFKDDGWVKIPQVEVTTNWERGKPDEHTVNGKRMMTGQEWYERFERELYIPKKQEYKVGTFTDAETKARFYRDGGTNFMYEMAIEAARRASGIEDAK